MDRNELLTATRTAFLRAFNVAVHGLTGRTAETLFGMADHARNLTEQRDLLDIRVVLMSREHEIQESLISSMERLLNRSYQTAYASFRPSFSSAFSSQSLSLVDASVFDGELRIDEITTRMRNMAEEQLRDLNIRMAVLFDQDNINERENPFRPYLISRCLSLAVEHLGLTPTQHDLLTAVMAGELMSKVSGIYEELNQLLASKGIAAQLQLRVRQLPGHMPTATQASEAVSAGSAAADMHPGSVGQPHAVDVAPAQAAGPQRLNRLLELVRAQAGGIEPAGGMPAAAPQAWSGMDAMMNAPAAPGHSGSQHGGWLASVQGIGHAVRQLFSGHGGAGRAGEPMTASLTQSIDTLQQASIAGQEPLLDAQGQVRNLILEMRPQLSEATEDINEQMIIDIVGMLFEFILRDGQVPAEIRAQLGRLQLLVLKSALQNPALFSQKHHPARLLVNRIGSIAQGLQQLDPNAERITAEIRRIIEALLTEDEEDVALFARMLDELDAFIARELRAGDDKVDRAARAMEHAEGRTLRYARVSAQSAEALAAFTLDAQLRDFFVNTWAYAIEHAERDDAVTALRYRMLVPELLWSIAPKTDRAERQELLTMIPSLLATLTEGLQHTPWTVAQRQAFQSWLVDAHRHALRITSSNVQVPSVAELRARFTDFIGQTAEEVDSSNLVTLDAVNPVLLEEAIGEIAVELRQIDRLVEESAARSDVARNDAPAPEEDSVAQMMASLRAGVTIEINLVGQPVKAKLCWMSPTESSMVLTLDGEAAPSLLSVSVFRRMLANGRLRLLEDAPLFERAIASLLNTADAMDAQHPQ
ncbi:DUF1631 family protein [Chitinilyticum aquatile]|uniref:DUF1631 family protein n=1 Tax=Chitinilyticum aquatile TaxID=362520 RepID=UPI0003FA249B|nr:DUF1631 family protein [Chitinilyticum aquatile]